MRIYESRCEDSGGSKPLREGSAAPREGSGLGTRRQRAQRSLGGLVGLVGLVVAGPALVWAGFRPLGCQRSNEDEYRFISI